MAQNSVELSWRDVPNDFADITIFRFRFSSCCFVNFHVFFVCSFSTRKKDWNKFLAKLHVSLRTSDLLTETLCCLFGRKEKTAPDRFECFFTSQHFVEKPLNLLFIQMQNSKPPLQFFVHRWSNLLKCLLFSFSLNRKTFALDQELYIL